MHVLCNTVRNGYSRSSKVVDFGTKRQHICDFQLVINSNLGPTTQVPHGRTYLTFTKSAACTGSYDLDTSQWKTAERSS